MSERPAERIEFLRRLRAVRAFTPWPVPQAAIDDILEVARWSGSAKNLQPWEFIVIRDRATLGALAKLSPNAGHLARAPLGIALVMSGDDDLFDTYDEGRLSERVMLAAAAHGLGSCIGWFRGGTEVPAKELLGIPPQRLLRTVISIGYPDTAALGANPRREQPRKPLSEIVHEERRG